MNDSNYSVAEPTYRIGAVARVTGIPADTLRMWERRYRVVRPTRAEGGGRLYTRGDIGRLAVIKRLVDAGHAISTVAHLNAQQLEQRMEPVVSASGRPSTIPVDRSRVAVLGDALPVRLTARDADMPNLAVVGVFRDRRRFEDEVRQSRPDVVLMEYPTVHEDKVSEIRRLWRKSGAARAVVVYAFSSRTAVVELGKAGVRMLRAPIEIGEIADWCRPAPDSPVPALDAKIGEVIAGPIPERRYDSEELGRLAGISTTVKCECPLHLAELIMSLTAFEDYSVECESRSLDDAALHAYLHATTARARAMLEQALERVAAAEGIGPQAR